jgi:DNA-binding transcriptional regulator YhcF (GntR family)
VIEFRLVGHSNVAVYMQLVQQVKQALRLGRLEPGEQLPTVREVAAALAINPHTVLKAYRELELAGMIEGRAGQGTFVRQSAPGRALTRQAALHRELVGWLRRARAAGWDRNDVIALVDTTLRTEFDQGLFEGIA